MLDILELWSTLVDNLKSKRLSLHSPLEEMVLASAGLHLAYVDNRRDALKKFRVDFWEDLKKSFSNEVQFLRWMQEQGIRREILYSKSEHFPDFIFKCYQEHGRLFDGSLLELKDSKGGTIASFNSTLPTRFKTLDEVDAVNGDHLVSHITSMKENLPPELEEYRTYPRKCFYLVRTHNRNYRVRLSVVDGSFFETVPREHLLYQAMVEILQESLQKEGLDFPRQKIDEFQRLLSSMTDQSIIAKSREISGASIRPRFRVMAEVHSEGNPHNPRFYPEIKEGTANLILKDNTEEETMLQQLLRLHPDLQVFRIFHQRNGKHLVIQWSPAG